ncbi:MAG: NRDE family protein [Planctomycetota bacterium]|jgi:uncharacterized protein with NRDE domain
MCVLICRVGERPLLGANRDEEYARPFTLPRLWEGAVPFWAPRDEREGGTWIGVNASGLIAAITNLSRRESKPGRPSRGYLVAGLLAQPGLEAARAWLDGELAKDTNNPCQLLLMQGRRAAVCAVDADEREWRELPPGVHVLSNLHDSDEIELGLPADAEWEQIRAQLIDRTRKLPRGFAVNKDAGWRGTVASALIEPGERFLFTPGKPDEVGYAPVPGYPR